MRGNPQDPAVRHTYSVRMSLIDWVKRYAEARGWPESMVLSEAVRQYRHDNDPNGIVTANYERREAAS